MSVLEDIRKRIIEISNTITTERGETAKGALFVPPLLATNQLPLMSNIWGATNSVAKIDTNLYEITRRWEITMIIQKAGIGQYSENENRIAEWIEAVYKAFIVRPQLQLNGVGMRYVTNAVIFSDDGGGIKSWPVGGNVEQFYTINFVLNISYEQGC